MRFDMRRVMVGLLFAVVGIFFAATALKTLPLGTALRMGPGYFPLLISILLLVAAAAQLLPTRKLVEGFTFHPLPWRALLMISLCPIVFALTVRGAGLIPSVAFLALLSALSSEKVGLRFLAIFVVGMTIFCVLLFGIALKLPIDYIGPWFTV